MSARVPPEKVPLLQLSHATVLRGSHRALDDVDLTLREGEHVAILGPNGAGKSTLIQLITRDVRALYREGPPPVLLRGQARWNLFDARKLFGVVSDSLQGSYTRPVRVRDAILSGFFGSIGVYGHQRPTREMGVRVEALLGFLEISHLADRSMDTLSTGEARRALIGRALAPDPPALVLDEPVDGLDPHSAHHFLRLLRQIAVSGKTLVLVTHHVDDIVPEITRIVMLREGKVFRDGPKLKVLTSTSLAELFGIPVRLEERGGWYRLWPAEEV